MDKYLASNLHQESPNPFFFEYSLFSLPISLAILRIKSTCSEGREGSAGFYFDESLAHISAGTQKLETQQSSSSRPSSRLHADGRASPQRYSVYSLPVQKYKF